MIARGAEARQTKRRRLRGSQEAFHMGVDKGLADGYAGAQIRLFKADHPCDSSPGQFLMKPRRFVLVDGWGSVKKE